MKIVYLTEKENDLNVYVDIRIENDNYVLLETEKLLTNIFILIGFQRTNIIDYNDFRKYAIINILPLWNTLSENEKIVLKSYYIIPNDFTFNSEEEEQQIYKLLVDNATKCREKRIDEGRSYVSLFYKNDIQKSMDFFIDTELLMNQYIKGKIPALQAFINSTEIAGFDYKTNGFSTKNYYDLEIKNQLNYLLFR